MATSQVTWVSEAGLLHLMIDPWTSEYRWVLSGSRMCCGMSELGCMSFFGYDNTIWVLLDFTDESSYLYFCFSSSTKFLGLLIFINGLDWMGLLMYFVKESVYGMRFLINVATIWRIFTFMGLVSHIFVWNLIYTITLILIKIY